MYFVMYPVICVLAVFGILTTILLLQNLYPSLALGCSFSFRLFCCWILCTDGMRTGSPRMSSSGRLLAVAISYTCLGSHWCFFCIIYTLLSLQVHGSVGCLGCLLHCHVLFLGSPISLVHSIWTWLRTQPVFHCLHVDSCFCVCYCCSAPKGTIM